MKIYWLKTRRWLIVLLTLALYFPTFVWMKERFLAAGSDYSHGFLIPFISGFLIWRMRGELTKLAILPSKKGLPLIIGGLILHVLGQGFMVDFVCGFSLILVLFGFSLAFFGAQMTKRLIFPISFLVFMVPLPHTLTIFLTFHMKIFATAWASWTASLMGIPAVAEGARVVLPDDFLIIGAPCSGLRSLISLLALGTVFAYLLPLPFFKRLIVFISAAPLALLSNMVRIVFLIIITYIYGQEASLREPTHTLSGLIVFLVAFMGLGIVGRLLLGKGAKATQPEEVEQQVSTPILSIHPPYGLVCSLLSAALILVILFLLPHPISQASKLKELPLTIGNWAGRDIPIDESAYKMLYDSELLLRSYKNSQGQEVLLFVVASRTNREAFHAPELCYEGVNAQFLEKEITKIQIGRREIEINKLYLKEDNKAQLVLYWFSAGQVSTPNFYLQQLMFILNQAMRKGSNASLIRVSAVVPQGQREEAFELEKAFIKEVSPLLEEYTE